MSTPYLLEIDKMDIQDPGAVLEEIEAIRLRHDPAIETINWIGIAYIASSLARDKLSVEWAGVALAAYDILSSSDMRTEKFPNYQVDAMMVKAYLIAHLGEIPHHPILDASAIVRWFLSDVQLPAPEAAKLAVKLGHKVKMPIDERLFLLQLRRLKNRLQVIELIKHTDAVHSSSAIQEWLKVANTLP